MRSSTALLALAATASAQVITDWQTVSQYWGQVTPYSDNDESYFGVEYQGLPSGCQIEQVHLLQRHANRFPTGGDDDGGNDVRFSQKLANFTSANPDAVFGGKLAFLSSYQYLLGSSYLTGLGASTEFMAGVTFWNHYGRLLYNSTAEQLQYNGTGQTKPVLRTTSQSRIYNSAINWALGFFGTSWQAVPDPSIAGFDDLFTLVIIPEGGTENNTLASYDACAQSDTDDVGYYGDNALFKFLPIYLKDATSRLNAEAPAGFTFTYNDTYAMQSICAYESGYLGVNTSPFCGLFTLEEWKGFEQTLNIEYFYDYSFGNPTGRAQGIGYLQELVARLTNQYITSSNSSVNSSYDGNADTFPLGQKFYADFSHDDIIVSALTAMSMDYFNNPPSVVEYPVNFTNFQLSHMTPFGGRLVTEVIGCAVADPEPVINRFQYYPTQWGYDADNATHKFIRMRLNYGILPMDSIRGDFCKNGRPDGLCSMDDFLASQESAYALSNYDYACFGNYTITEPFGHNFDGTISE